MSENNDSTESEKLTGPVIIAIANALRAFDAPVRYPVIFSRYVWGSTKLSDAVALAQFSSFLVAVEHLIGTLVIFPVLLVKNGIGYYRELMRTLSRREWFSLTMICIGSGFGLYFFLISFALGNPTIATLLQSTQPVLTVIIAMLYLRERPIRLYYVVAVFALLGFLIMTISGFEDGNELFGFIAVVCAMIAALLWGGNTVWGREVTKKVNFWDLTALRYLGSTIILLVFGLITLAFTSDNIGALTENFSTFTSGDPDNPAPIDLAISMSGWLTLLYSAIITGGVIGLVLYYFGLQSSKAVISALAELAFPLLAIFVNYLFLGFGLNLGQIIGAIILLGATTSLSLLNKLQHQRESK